MGDFSASPRLIYDPDTTTTVGTTFVRDPFPGNRIPANRLDPVALRVSELLPATNLTGAGALNYEGFIGEKLLDPDVYLVRIDHAFNMAHRIFGTFNRTAIPRSNVTSAIADPLGTRTLQFITSEMIRGNYDWVVRPSLLNTALVGWNMFRNPFQGFYANQGFAERFGLKGIAGDSFPSFSFTDGYSGLGNNSFNNNTLGSFIAKDILSYTRGRQVMKFGVEYRLIPNRVEEYSTTAGDYSFSNLGTALPTRPNTTGDGYASFLLGRTQSASLSLPFKSSSRKPYWGFFFQDDIRVTPSLTLNLGVRYEITGAPWEINDQYSMVDFNTRNPAAANRPGATIFAGSGPGRIGSRRLVDTDYSGFGPRFGFAWQLDQKTVVRGGYGLFYGDNGISTVSDGFRVTRSYQSLDQGITTPFLLKDGFPDTLDPSPVLGPSIRNGQNVTYRSPTIGAMPRTQNWSLGIQRALTVNWAMELSYLANKNTRQPNSTLVNENQIHPRYLALGSLLTQNITSAAAAAADIARPYPSFTGSVNQALRAYPQYLNMMEQSAKAGSSLYNAVTGRLRRRYASGLTFDAHYTFSRNIGYVDTLQDNFNRQLEYSLLENDYPHSFLMNYTYELPFGPGKPFAGGKRYARLAGGWILNGIHRYQSGSPLYVNMTNSLPIFNRTLRPDVVAGVKRASGIPNSTFDHNTDRHINPAAFRNPAPFTFGNAAPGYNDLRNFNILAEDFSIIKHTAVNERVSIETTAQFINAFNRHRFTDINANFSNTTFGTAAGSNLGRIITLKLKVKF